MRFNSKLDLDLKSFKKSRPSRYPGVSRGEEGSQMAPGLQFGLVAIGTWGRT